MPRAFYKLKVKPYQLADRHVHEAEDIAVHVVECFAFEVSDEISSLLRVGKCESGIGVTLCECVRLQSFG